MPSVTNLQHPPPPVNTISMGSNWTIIGEGTISMGMKMRDRNPSNPKTAAVCVPVTCVEKEALERAAHSRGLAVANYVRQRLFAKPALAYEPRRDGLMSGED